jgi:hypothetical protein
MAARMADTPESKDFMKFNRGKTKFSKIAGGAWRIR